MDLQKHRDPIKTLELPQQGISEEAIKRKVAQWYEDNEEDKILTFKGKKVITRFMEKRRSLDVSIITKVKSFTLLLKK